MDVLELSSFMDDDYASYMRLQAVRKNQLKHLERGRWNFVQSIKGFRHAVDAGAKNHAKIYDGSSFSATVRNEVARNYAEDFAARHGIPTKNLVG